MRKILYVHHGGGLGGAPRSLSFLLDRLDKTRYKSRLLCIFKGPVLELFKKRDIEIIVEEKISPFHGSTVVKKSLIQIVRNIIRLPSSFIAAFRQIKAFKPDIIHLNSSCLFIVAAAAKFVSRDIKVICHVREPLRRTLSGKIIKFMCFKYVDHFVAIDSFTGGSMRTSNNMSIIYNSVDFASYNTNVKSNCLRAELGLDSHAVIFIYLARVAPSNGTLEFVNIANKLSRENADFHFVIVGFKEESKDRYSACVSKAALNSRNIHLMTFRSNVPELIASSDIMVAPFTEPHFARSVIEASALGKPSIGANVGGVDELIKHGETGYLYSNEAEFYAFCEELGKSSDRRNEFGLKANDFALNNFDVIESSKEIFKIYDDI